MSYQTDGEFEIMIYCDKEFQCSREQETSYIMKLLIINLFELCGKGYHV